ncbi:hypothetical protein CPB97_005190, partial [Podila verticillata]
FIECFWPEFTFWKLLPILLRYQLRAATIAESRRAFSEEEQQQQAYIKESESEYRVYSNHKMFTNDNNEAFASSPSSSSSVPSTNPWQSFLNYFGGKSDSTYSSACSSDTEVETEYRHQRSSSESTITSDDLDEDKRMDPALHHRLLAEKQERVTSFLTHRGDLPTCPLVQLQ